MPIDYNKITVRVDLDRIKTNFEILNRLGGNAAAVVKSDAYGHGLLAVSRTLAKAGAKNMAVGTVEEGVRLRKMPYEGRILVLMGPLDLEEYEDLAEHGLVPFIVSFEQLSVLDRIGRRRERPVKIALKFDTGMARLGFTIRDLPEIISRLCDMPGLAVDVVGSHLAVADEPDGREFTLEQGRIFGEITAGLRKAGFCFQASLANTAGLMAWPELRHDLQRPGLGLYGANPLAGTDLADLGKGLRPAMQVTAPVIQVHDLARGRTVSYGRTFTAPRDMRVAVVAAGYSDAYSRRFSNNGVMSLNGSMVPVVGRVCMQTTVVDVTGVEVKAGDRAFILGGPENCFVTAEELARRLDTITYEVFCLLGLNRKTYQDG